MRHHNTNPQRDIQHQKQVSHGLDELLHIPGADILREESSALRGEPLLSLGAHECRGHSSHLRAQAFPVVAAFHRVRCLAEHPDQGPCMGAALRTRLSPSTHITLPPLLFLSLASGTQGCGSSCTGARQPLNSDVPCVSAEEELWRGHERLSLSSVCVCVRGRRWGAKGSEITRREAHCGRSCPGQAEVKVLDCSHPLTLRPCFLLVETHREVRGEAGACGGSGAGFPQHQGQT